MQNTKGRAFVLAPAGLPDESVICAVVVRDTSLKPI
jgi:hypothetical protein